MRSFYPKMWLPTKFSRGNAYAESRMRTRSKLWFFRQRGLQQQSYRALILYGMFIRQSSVITNNPNTYIGSNLLEFFQCLYCPSDAPDVREALPKVMTQGPFRLSSLPLSRCGIQVLQAFWHQVERRVRETLGGFCGPTLEVLALTFIFLEHSGMATPICKWGWEI